MKFKVFFRITEHSLQLQSACEIIRQHLDTGGVRNISTFKWQQVIDAVNIETCLVEILYCKVQFSFYESRDFIMLGSYLSYLTFRLAMSLTSLQQIHIQPEPLVP